jgi:hypothetical protein
MLREGLQGGSMSTTEQPAGRRDPSAPRIGGAYTLHPLSALDGVLIHLVLNGETAGYAFGSTEEEAAALAAQQLLGSAAASSRGVEA